MQRIPALEPNQSPLASKTLLDAVKKQIGMVPNLYKSIAHSPAALQFALGQSAALAEGVLPAALREQIALVAAGTNSCDYCASAHTLMGKGAGLEAREMSCNLRGQSSDAKTQAALTFAKTIVEARGQVSDEQLDAVRHAGYDDAEIVEIVAHVAMNIFTNYFNHIAGTVIDFPRVDSKQLAAAA
jgi:uncharacterized peroxidase-related enzyme